jgi:FkbM family methyltransferase
MAEFYREEVNVFRKLKEAGFSPKTIFDVGASDGGWSFYVSEVFPEATFHLFEPLIDHKQFYRDNTARILTQRPQFSLHKFALGEMDGEDRMFSDESGYSASLLPMSPDEYFPETIKVSLKRLDSFVMSQQVEPPALLKMDVQGAELAILKGAGELLDKIEVIQAECWLVRSYGATTPLLHEVKSYLDERGFALFEVRNFFFSEIHELYALDAFFARKVMLEKTWTTSC